MLEWLIIFMAVIYLYVIKKTNLSFSSYSDSMGIMVLLLLTPFAYYIYKYTKYKKFTVVDVLYLVFCICVILCILLAILGVLYRKKCIKYAKELKDLSISRYSIMRKPCYLEGFVVSNNHIHDNKYGYCTEVLLDTGFRCLFMSRSYLGIKCNVRLRGFFVRGQIH